MPGNERGPYKAGPEEIWSAILGSKEPVVTAGDLAEMLDVSEPTIRNHMDEVVDMWSIKSRKIGRTTVYWPDTRDSVETLGTPRASRNVIRDDAMSSVARWRDEKQSYYEEIQENGSTPVLRARAWQEMMELWGATDFDFRLETDPDTGEWGLHEDYGHRDGLDITAEEIESYLFDHYLFTSDWSGAVRGFADLQKMNFDVDSRLKELVEEEGLKGEDRLSYHDLPEQELDEIFPSMVEIIGTADTLEHVVRRLWGIRW